MAILPWLLIALIAQPTVALPFIPFKYDTLSASSGAARRAEVREALTGSTAHLSSKARRNDTDVMETVYRYLNNTDHFTWVDTGARLHGSAWVGSAEVLWTGYVLNVSSGLFLTPADSNRPVWWHPLVVIEPSGYPGGEAPASHATFYVGGAETSWTTMLDPSKITTKDVDVQGAVDLAVNTGMITAALLQVPNQPIIFTADPTSLPLSEDAYKAFAYVQFLSHPDRPDRYDWQPDLRMLKAVVRGMDALAAFSRQTLGGEVTNFAVTGCSKRGLASWQAAIFDPRVSQVLPCVMPLKNAESMTKGYAAYGGYTYSMKDYVNVMKNVDPAAPPPAAPQLSPQEELDERLNAMLSEPYENVDLLTKPKFVMLANDDQFFLPDQSRLYYDDLPEPKHFFGLPNSPHVGMLGMGNFIPAMAPFLRAGALGLQEPKVTWNISKTTGAITARQETPHVPTKVSLWYAHSCGERRDFRFLTMDAGEDCLKCGVPLQSQYPSCLNLKVSWTETPLAEASPGTWEAQVEPPAEGSWTAFMVMFEYADKGPMPFKFTTEVSIVPLEYPYEPCPPDQVCGGGNLVLAQEEKGAVPLQKLHELVPMWPHWGNVTRL